MSEAGEANLYLGGGTCAPYECIPYGATPEEWEAFCERRGVSYSGLGSKPQYNINIGDKMNYEMFPQPDIEEESRNVYTVAGHRAPASFGLSRMLDFGEVPVNSPRIASLECGKGWPNQDSLRKWFLMNIDDIVDGYCLNMVHIPPHHRNRSVYWCNTCPVEGLTFDVKLKYSGTVLAAGVDASTCDGGYIDIPAPDDFRKNTNEIIQLVLNGVPPKNEDPCKPGCGSLDGWCIMISAEIFCPMTGK